MNNRFDKIDENEKIEWLELKDMEADPDQPRKVKPEAKIVALGRSIETTGQHQAIIVRPHPRPESGKKYMIVCGECRYSAHTVREKLRARGVIKAVVRNYTEEDLKEIRHVQMVENLARIDQEWLETADSFRDAVARGDTPEGIAEALGYSASIIRRDIELAGMHEEIRKAINDKTCPLTVAEHILKAFPDDDAAQSIAWSKARRTKTAANMKEAVNAYLADTNQKSIFDNPEEVNDPQARKDAGKAFTKLQKAIKSFEKNGYNNGKAALVIKAKKGQLNEVQETIKSLSRMAAHYEATIRKFKAQSGQLEETEAA